MTTPGDNRLRTMKTWTKTFIQLATLASALPAAVLPAMAETLTNSTPTDVTAPVANKWEVSASAYYYAVPDSEDYVQPSLTADYGWLHLEGRYNYEALDTGSAWVGYNFSGGEKLAWEFTPMIGGVFGETEGVAPGFRFSLSWWKLELSSEAEYVFNSAGRDLNFFYAWSELSLAPMDWLRFGLVGQRTRAYTNDVDIQRGFLVGLSYKQASVTTYVFNPDQSKPTVVVAVALNF